MSPTSLSLLEFNIDVIFSQSFMSISSDFYNYKKGEDCPGGVQNNPLEVIHLKKDDQGKMPFISSARRSFLNARIYAAILKLHLHSSRIS